MKKKLIKILILAAILVVAFTSGYYVGVEEATITNPDDELDFSLFWEAYNRLKDNYVDSEQIDDEEIVHGAIRGMVDSLDDPHTSFYDQKESKEFLDDVSGQYGGVGMEVGIRNGELRVISPLDGTPASRAGIRSGDIILEIENESTVEMSLEEAVDKMRGEEGTDVSLVIGRNNQTYDYNLTRAEIQVPSVDWELLEEEIVYLQIHYFHQDLTSEFNKIVPEISALNKDKMILDLRSNPGGALDSALEVAKFFLDRGDVIVKSQGADGEIQTVYEAESSSVTFNHELVVLINEGSASASEIMAESLRYHNEARIVGKPSFGKGSIQSLINLSDMSNLKVTVSNWVTPEGTLITDKGIIPDYEVEITDENFEKEEDPQLDKAIEILKN